MSWIVFRVYTQMVIFHIPLKRMTSSNKPGYLRTILESAPFSKYTALSMVYPDTLASIQVEWLSAKGNWMRSFHWKTPRCQGAPLFSGIKTIAKIWGLLKLICSDWE